MLNRLPHFRHLTLILFLQISLFGHSSAQDALDTTGMRQGVKKAAELFWKAGLAGDYNTVIKHYHPEQIEASGGEKNLLKELKAGNGFKNKVGFSDIKYSVTLPEELLIDGNNVQCAFRYTLHLPKTNVSEAQPHQSTMIAVSEDRGKNWYFLDAQDTPVDRLTMYFSFINPNLSLPVDPAVQAQRDALNWEIKPFISGKEILNFNRKEQRITFSVTEALLSSREGLISTQGKMLLKPEFMSVEDRDSLIIVYSEDDLDGAAFKPGSWDQQLPLPDNLEDINQLKNSQEESVLSGLTLGNPIGKNEGFSSIQPYPGLPYFMISKEVNGESKFGLMDQSGKIIIQPNYDYPIKLNAATYALPKGEKWELKSIKNHQPLLAGQSFDDVEFAGDYFIVNHYDKETLEVYSNDQEKKFNLDFDDIVLDSEVMIMNGKEVLLLGTMEGKIGYYLDGNSFLPAAVFKDIIQAGLIFIQNGKWGLINRAGKTLVPAALDEIKYLEDSESLWGKINGKWGLLKL